MENNITILDKIKAKKKIINDYIHNKFNKIKEFVSNNDVEVTTCISAFFIIYPSFLINKIFGLYIIGLLFGALAVFIAKYPKK
jgi:hypothetical protein